MKKLIIALAVFLVMIGAAVFEIVYTTNTFDRLSQLSEETNRRFVVCADIKRQQDKEGQSAASEAALTTAEGQANESLEAVQTYWAKNRTLALVLGNHTIVKSVEEKLTSLQQQTQIQAWEDASVLSAVLKAYFDDLKDDNHITLTNLF